MPTSPHDSPNSQPGGQPSLIYALIPCGGHGARAQTALPKQYQRVAGLPVVAHTLAAFAAVPRIAKTLTVLAAGDTGFAQEVAAASNATHLVAYCAADTRANTVLNGLQALLMLGATANDWVLVHDAARCLVTPNLINALIDACEGDAVGGLLALPLADTLKSADGQRVQATLGRADKWLAQTPQMFRIGMLVDALTRAGALATDESSAIEALGHAPRLVVGSAQNFKITYPDDFALAQAVLDSRKTAL